MEILYLLIPLSAVLVLLIIAMFGWALGHGQFDDLEREGSRILQNGDAGGATPAALPPRQQATAGPAGPRRGEPDA